MLRKVAVAMILLMMAFTTLAADKPQSDKAAKEAPKKEINPEDVPRISVDELILLQSKKAVFIIDARTKDSYTEKIVGAAQIPFDEIESRLKEIPHDKEIVTYCA